MAIFKIENLKEHTQRLQERLIQYQPFKKCILIGSGCSLKLGNFKDRIQNADAVVIRVNRHPKPEFYQYYGNRYELMITWKRKVNEYNKEFSFQNKFFNSVVNQFFKSHIFSSTGLGCILLLGTLFDEIELFGFGLTQRQFQDADFHYLDGTQFTSYHNLKIEDHLINQLQTMYPGKIYRGEEQV